MSNRVSEILIHKLTTWPKPLSFTCRKELLCGPDALTRFYLNRVFKPAWSDNDGPLPQATDLVKKIREADRDGLRPDDYHFANIEALLAEVAFHKITNRPFDPSILADLDLLLTDAFLLYGSHLLTGHVNPETIQSEWLIKTREADLVVILETALNTNEIEKALENLLPQYAGYVGLKKALSQYRNILKGGGWSEVPSGSIMEKGDRATRVCALKTRLSISGDLELPAENDCNIFDGDLDRAVRRFQERHGLQLDGIVGRSTLKALNIPVNQQVGQLKSNLERWRWLPQTLGSRYILVNIANFELRIVENGQTVIKMPVVVGRRYRRTPVFTGNMTYLELNPHWHVPHSIAREDILPKVQKDPQYLIRQNMKVFQSWEANAPEIAPESVDWSKITSRNLSFKLRQEPGPANALGRVKFMFPNKFSVYLHDTPAKELFKKPKRSFSSGCIRVEKPIELIAYLFRNDPNWTRQKIREVINSDKTQIVQIPEPIPVHLLYWTAWVDSEGRIHFRDDVYGRDKRLIRALSERPPTP
ncbi:MAG: L,D-transpeptidase family protein [Desulfobacteraceae bacterium]|nr:MAG: L,D-transpeptidase family protein [Desulfobacteraceae bacterium]